MPNAIQKFFSGEISIGTDSWHYRLYKWWEGKTGGNSWNYRENLCHYVRVILIWVPLVWLGTTTIFDRVRPWMVVATILGGVVAWFVPEFRATFLTWTAGGVALYFIEYHKEGTKKVVLRIAPPFVFLWEHGIWPALRVFFTFGRWGIYPWSITLVALIAFGAYLLGLDEVLQLLKILGIVLGAVAAIIVVIVLLYGAYKLLKKLLPKDEPYYPRPYVRRERGSRTLQIAGQFVMAKKRKICPFINLPEKDKSRPMWSSQR